MENNNKILNNKIIKYISLFFIIFNMIIILFVILLLLLLLFFDFFEANRPMIILNFYLIYSYTLMLPINIGNTILATKYKDYYSKRKNLLIMCSVIFLDIISFIRRSQDGLIPRGLPRL